MGDASPDRFDLVCGACGTEFSRIVSSNVPPTFDCPECGEPVEVPERAGDKSSDSRDVERGFSADAGPTARVTRPGAEGEVTEIQEEDTAKDQESVEEARERSREMKAISTDEDDDGALQTGPDDGDGRASDDGPSLDPGRDSLGRDFGGGGDPHEQETSVSTESIPSRSGAGGEDGASGSGEEAEDVEKTPHVGMDKIAEGMAREEGLTGEDAGADGGDDGDGEAVQKTPHVGMDQIAEEMAESGSLPGDESTEAVATGDENGEGGPPDPPSTGEEDGEPPTEESDERSSDQTPATAMESAFDDSVPPEIGEETEAAIDEALDEEFEESEAEDDEGGRSGGPSSAQELVTSLREESGIEGDPESAYDTAELSERGDQGGDEPSAEEAEGPPPMPGEESPDSEVSPAAETLEQESDPPHDALDETIPPEGTEGPWEGGADGAPIDPGPEGSGDPDGGPAAQAGGTGAPPPEASAPAGSDLQRDSEPLPEDQPAVPSEPAGVSEPQGEPEQSVDVSESPGGAAASDDHSTLLLLAAGVLAMVAATLGLVVYFNPGGVLDRFSGGDGAGTSRSASSSSGAGEVGAAIEKARGIFRDASDVDVEDRSVQKSSAKRLSEKGAHQAAARVYGHLWREQSQNAAFAESYLDALLAAKQWSEARRAAVSAGATTGKRETFRAKYREAVDGDPRLQGYEPVELSELEGAESLELAEGADTDGLLVTGLEGRARYVFSPATGTTGEWRDDVAAWRLCELIVCEFSIPETRPARISKSAFGSMLDAEAGTRERLAAEFEWTDAEGADEPVVYGSLRKWRSDAVRWPIEMTDVWRPWLSAETDLSILDEPIEEALSEMKELGDGSVYEKVIAESKGATTREVAGQLSDIIVFDFLTNNWDRFADGESEYGSYNHFADGRFVTLRTTTVFQRRKSTRVKGRFRWISRYDRDTIAALRALEPDRVDPILYPDANGYDRAKLDIFWEQRSTVLDRVDSAMQREGRESVLAFD